MKAVSEKDRIAHLIANAFFLSSNPLNSRLSSMASHPEVYLFIYIKKFRKDQIERNYKMLVFYVGATFMVNVPI